MAAELAPDTDLITFADESDLQHETQSSLSSTDTDAWQVLLVDDEPDVHEVTQIVLKDIRLLGHPLAFTSAFSAAEAFKLLQERSFACILLDVVMETEDAGLRLVGRIRDELEDKATRIILRTGQPGQAPEMQVIDQYDINDYASKADLTRNRLITSITSALRTYRQIHALEESQFALQDAQLHLEARVEERTAALLKNQETLKRALLQLKKTQSRMLYSEKMASIGQLAAGVAHEINNPIGFISSNLSTLGKYMQEINSMLEAGQLLVNQLLEQQITPALRQDTEQLQQQMIDNELDYMLSDIKDLLHESHEGVDRVKNIVSTLESFTSHDQQIMEKHDINALLRSAIEVVLPQFKDSKLLTTSLSPLPQINCMKSELLQSFINLLINAAMATRDNEGKVRISTRDLGNGWIRINFFDTGCGIDKDYLQKIFDPFFTTRDVGQGTGLGLSIVYNTVVAHHGKIKATSRVSKGTLFRIQLPV
ncbi:hybrid sensor histidine kinase/response regulator [Nitrincola sp. MINF-07-Sa-05]|uniref:hybrid sensor histidine kinase/response regulator n=1 Tax=Nitrincola salilacus TaxID=3400273 RepID=UPI003917EDCC